jgi:tetratricopeptide (TPR) repeat protein
MSTDGEIVHLQELLAAHRGTLGALLRQVAITTEAYALPAQLAGIANARKEIARIKASLRDAGVKVDDWMDDKEPSRTAESPKKSAFAPPQMARLTLLMEGDVQRFTSEEQASCIFLLSRAINIAPEHIRIVYIGAGSIRLIIELPEDAATRLISLREINAPALQKLRIQAVYRQLPATEQKPARGLRPTVEGNDHNFQAVDSMVMINLFGDYVAGDKFTGDKVMGDKIIHHYPQPRPTIDPAAAQALLDRMPLDIVPAPAALPAPHRMPLRHNPQFVGRASDLMALAAALKAPSSLPHTEEGVRVRAVAAITTGIGGVGKTQLAAEFAHCYGQFFAGGVFWLSFADPAGIDAQIADCFVKLYEEGGEFSQNEQVAKVYAAWEQKTPRLLIFDNCDDMPGATAEQLLMARLPKTGECRVLVTSRRGQWRSSLGISAHHLDILPRAESLALLRSQRADLSDTEADAIAKVLGYLPLGLSLAGRYLGSYSDDAFGQPVVYLANIQKQLLGHPSLAEGDPLSPTQREIGLRAAFDLGFKQLRPQDLIDALALTALTCAAYLAPGEPFPRNLLLATLGEDTDNEDVARQRSDALRRLVALGLLEVVEHGTLRIHRLIAAFVREAAGDDTALDAVRHVMIQEARNRNAKKNPAGFVPILPHLLALIPTAQQPENLRTAGLRNELGRYLWMRGEYEQAKTNFERSLHAREHTLGRDYPETARSLNNLALVYQDLGQNERARDFYQEALQIFDHQNPKSAEVAAIFGNLAVVQRDLGDAKQALRYCLKALKLCRQIYGDNHLQTALSFNNLAVEFHIAGKYAQARRLYRCAYAIYRAEHPNIANPEIARTLHNLGELLEDQGRYRRACPYFRRALAMLEQVLSPSHPDIADTMTHLAHCLRCLGEIDQANAIEQRISVMRESKQQDDCA